MTLAPTPTDDPLVRAIRRADPMIRVGRVAEAYGTLVRATGLVSRIGDLCVLKEPVTGQQLTAEAVGIQGHTTLLTPLGALEGLSTGMEVWPARRSSSIPVGPGLLGRILDAQCQPMDGGPTPECPATAPLYREAPDPMTRRPVDQPLATGVKAIDATLTTGQGQRVGLFAAAGGGKSTLLGMLARGADADVNVIVLVGERGREVREFIDDNLGSEGLAKSVLIIATSDRPALERARAALVGTAIAEYFRDRGLRVLLLMDSVTRYARALRDVGLAMGEPPTRRGFPPSVFSWLPRLFERAGNNDTGCITGFYTVLVEDADEGDDPIAEEVRSLLDGHIILSRQLAARSHYPAIDVLKSTSRVMNRIASAPHQAAAQRLREWMSKYNEIELLVQIGEYKSGTDALADQAIAAQSNIQSLLRQGVGTLESFDRTRQRLIEITQ
ncbi:FliI/YscN family ATPase [Saccharospirillum salsuginis]|uniref:protein-secreting ATPase n=1 Tax=Saccharospirillum salsuginis TaxID=418750 RepID=A0A918KUY5_9GAMM|nr:FliI/YscN family ATPase [Saccharospirillum salsuginis]GGX75304.1 EscN/YscN/HrcN family type III secretion system ATPase [Saccharospirillum salsuginis]